MNLLKAVKLKGYITSEVAHESLSSLSGTHKDPSECGVMAQLLVKPFGAIEVFMLGVLMRYGLFSFFLLLGAALLYMLATRLAVAQPFHYMSPLDWFAGGVLHDRATLMTGCTLVFLVGSFFTAVFASSTGRSYADSSDDEKAAEWAGKVRQLAESFNHP